MVLIGFDLEVLELLESIEYMNLIGYVDNQKIDFENFTYLGTDEMFVKKINKDVEVVLSMNIPKVRTKLFDFYRNNISSFVAHKSSNISSRARIGLGTIIQANTLISTKVSIGNGCFLNHSSAIHHESEIGDFTILAPNSLVLGRVKIGKECYIGAGAIIKENIIIGSNVIVGAGSVVINDIADNSVVVGSPAKKYLGK